MSEQPIEAAVLAVLKDLAATLRDALDRDASPGTFVLLLSFTVGDPEAAAPVNYIANTPPDVTLKVLKAFAERVGSTAH